MSDQSADVSDPVVAHLRSWLGAPFVEWVLNDPGDSLTEKQEEVARFLESRIVAGLAAHPHFPATNALAPLKGFDDRVGTTLLNELRVIAGGSLPSEPASIGDDLIDTLRMVARDAYGELLLPPDPLESLISPYSSPHGRRFVEIMRTDPKFPFSDEETDIDASLGYLRSTGSGGSLQALGVAPSLLQAAWETAQLDNEAPSLGAILGELEPLVSQARAAFARRPATVVGLASLTGVVLPEGTIVDLGWGRLRNAASHHHPHFMQSRSRQRTTRRLEDGSEIAISDAGEVLLQVTVPYEVSTSDDHLASDNWPTLRSNEKLNERILQVRLAHLLSSSLAEPPVLFVAWHRFIEPVTQGRTAGISDPSQYANRVPTLLSQEQVDSWVEWIRRLDSIPLGKLGVAPNRLLRASAERRDPYDSLVDAVIAWESLFAAETEAVLRVSAAMARLLHPPGQRRNDAKKATAAIYRTRSRIVHGVNVEYPEAYEASRDAIRLTVDAMRVLTQDRTDLIPLTSGERSTRLLLE